MQHVAIDVIRAKMLERTGQGLSDLNRKSRLGIVGQTMVLPALVSEFGLQENVGPRYQTRLISCCQALADPSLEIVPPLIGRINASKTRAECEFRQNCGAVFLPGSAIEKSRDG